MSYSSDVLNSLITSNGATMVGELPVLKKEAKLSFRCRCGTADVKTFVRAKISGLLCKKCTSVQRTEKRNKTNIDKYGNTCTLQAPEIMAKAKESLIKRFGCDNVFKHVDIQQSIKKTNLEKYGAENPFASTELKAKLRRTCKEKYGTEFPMQCKEVSDKKKATNMIKYGVEVSSKADSVKQKACETNLRMYGKTHHIVPVVMDKIKAKNIIIYGVEYSFQAEPVKEKIKETLMKRYGVDHSMKMDETKRKTRETNQKNYGCDHPLQNQDMKDMIKATNIIRYGVEYPNQSVEVQAKSQKTGLKYKLYTAPSGIQRNIQGFEHFALDILFNEMNLEEDDVHTDRKAVPRICYDNNTRYYFPDIWIESLNKIIEVKSTWTYKLHKESNIKKWVATVGEGHTMEFWIFTNKGIRTVVTDPHTQ